MRIPGTPFRWFLVGAVLVALLGAVAAEALDQQALLSSRHDLVVQSGRVDAQLAAAVKAGYTEDDLRPVRQRLTRVQQAPEPFLPWERSAYYSGQAAQLRELQDQIKQVQAQADAAAKQDLGQQVAAAQAGIDHDRSLEVPDQVVGGFTGKLADLTKRQAAAGNIGELRKAAADARVLVADLTAVATQQDAENAAVQQAADALFQQQNGNLGAMQAAAAAALAGGRNDATVGAYEAKPGRFPALAQLMDAYNRMEHYTARLSSGDGRQVAFGAAAIQRYAAQIHSVLLDNLGPKHIVVSFQAQHVWAYQGSNVVMESPVTTGIRGVTDYGTDFGPMKVLHTDHPWTMHSPYPKTSPFWYPDTVVQWTTFFTWSGESFHDASWESDYRLGPGSQFDPSTRSHGCIHLPYSYAQWMYGWADLGTPVDVVPGDGKPLAEQLNEITTDDQGSPLSPA